MAIRYNNTKKNNKSKKILIPKFSTVQERKNRKNMESSRKLQISELLCNCKNKNNYSHGALVEILLYINDIKDENQKLKTKRDNCIFEKELNKNLQNLLAIRKIIRLQHCNCFIEKGFFDITELPFKINVSNPEGKVILRKLLKYMKHNVLSTIDLINFLGLGPNVILPNTFSISHYDKKDKRKKELKQTSILGHAIRIIYKKSLIEFYNVHFNTPFFLDRSTSDIKLKHWYKYYDMHKNKNNKEVVNIINKDDFVILEKLCDMSTFDKNFEVYKKQHSKERSWLQTKRECFDPKDTLSEIIKGLNSKLYPELYFDLLGKIVVTNIKKYKAISKDILRNKDSEFKPMAQSSYEVSKKLGADFITIIEKTMDPYNFKKQPNIPPPFDKAKYIKQFSQKP